MQPLASDRGHRERDVAHPQAGPLRGHSAGAAEPPGTPPGGRGPRQVGGGALRSARHADRPGRQDGRHLRGGRGGGGVDQGSQRRLGAGAVRSR